MKDHAYWHERRAVALVTIQKLEAQLNRYPKVKWSKPLLSSRATRHEKQLWRQQLRFRRERGVTFRNLSLKLAKARARLKFIDQQILRTLKTRSQLIHEDPFK